MSPKLRLAVALVSILVAVSALHCASWWLEDVLITGVVKRSDKSGNEHGGILISASDGSVTAYSKPNGEFEITGVIAKSTTITVCFHADGYVSKCVHCDFKFREHESGDNKDYDHVCTVGTVTLEPESQ